MKSRQNERKKLIESYNLDLSDSNGLSLLVTDLLIQPATKKNLEIIGNVLNGRYSDFDSVLATPATQLYYDLQEAGYDDLAEKVPKGKYDHDHAAVEKSLHSEKDKNEVLR